MYIHTCIFAHVYMREEFEISIVMFPLSPFTYLPTCLPPSLPTFLPTSFPPYLPAYHLHPFHLHLFLHLYSSDDKNAIY